MYAKRYPDYPESKWALIPNGFDEDNFLQAEASEAYKRAVENKDEDGVAHYPGYSLEALKYLYEVRHISASGHETPDTDCGISSSNDELPCEYYVLSTDHYQIELMANLDKVPPIGSLIVAAFPKLAGGSGFPARCFAILP